MFISFQGAWQRHRRGQHPSRAWPAVAVERRLAALLALPALAEAGYPGPAITQWYGLMAPPFTTSDACRSALNLFIFLTQIN